MDIDYNYFAKKIISQLVANVFDEKLNDKTVTYLDLAKSIKFPEPYTGNYFQSNIGKALGEVCELIQNVNISEDLKPVPVIQTLVVSKTTKLPSYGLKVIVPGYDNFTDNEKRIFVMAEHQKIIQYGENWFKVLEALSIPITEKSLKSAKGKLFNKYGSEGSPEHRNVKKYIIEKHHLLGYTGHSEAIEEFPLSSGDKIDVVFKDKETIFAFEAKSIRSNEEDLMRGVFQCVKYKNVLEAEIKVGLRDSKKVVCSLVTESDLPKDLKKYCEQLGIKHYKVNVN